MTRDPFPSVYGADDVRLLLTPLTITPTEVAAKEQLIQSGAKHYSEMLSREEPPTPAYQALFEEALQRGADRLAREVAALAQALDRAIPGPVTLVSLLRAGLPLGVLLQRALRALGRDSRHYGLSILRGRGIDRLALADILADRPATGVVFVDGWTGKGAIADELEKALADFPGLLPRLVVWADPAGRAWLAGSGEDWLLPTGLLGATISGLTSRTLLTDAIDPTRQYHGAMVWEHLRPFDRSRSFADHLTPLVLDHLTRQRPAVWPDDRRRSLRASAAEVIDRLAGQYGVSWRNRLKPGIAEATRALLRRVPDRVFVTSDPSADLAALAHLAERAGVPLEPVPEGLGPYQAVTLIRKVD